MPTGYPDDQHPMLSQWCCPNLGGKTAAFLHKPPVAVVETEKSEA